MIITWINSLRTDTAQLESLAALDYLNSVLYLKECLYNHPFGICNLFFPTEKLLWMIRFLSQAIKSIYFVKAWGPSTKCLRNMTWPHCMFSLAEKIFSNAIGAPGTNIHPPWRVHMDAYKHTYCWQGISQESKCLQRCSRKSSSQKRKVNSSKLSKAKVETI